jgi:hypothetical protein
MNPDPVDPQLTDLLDPNQDLYILNKEKNFAQKN